MLFYLLTVQLRNHGQREKMEKAIHSKTDYPFDYFFEKTTAGGLLGSREGEGEGEGSSSAQPEGYPEQVGVQSELATAASTSSRCERDCRKRDSSESD